MANEALNGFSGRYKKSKWGVGRISTKEGWLIIPLYITYYVYILSVDKLLEYIYI